MISRFSLSADIGQPLSSKNASPRLEQAASISFERHEDAQARNRGLPQAFVFVSRGPSPMPAKPPLASLFFIASKEMSPYARSESAPLIAQDNKAGPLQYPSKAHAHAELLHATVSIKLTLLLTSRQLKGAMRSATSRAIVVVDAALARREGTAAARHAAWALATCRRAESIGCHQAARYRYRLSTEKNFVKGRRDNSRGAIALTMPRRAASP